MQGRKIKLEGFNNLTKTLSFNIYDVCYARSRVEVKNYLAYIDEAYNAERLTEILCEVTRIINANILNIASQDYDPHGSSVTMMIAEGEVPTGGIREQEKTPGPLLTGLATSLVGHLDKSHITVHTYPESHPEIGISTFRADIDVSTCGHISPLKALNYLIHAFESDIVIMDYRVRGFTRDTDGSKHFIDHEINSIQDYLAEDTKGQYQMLDVNVYEEQMFHTKMRLNTCQVQDYLFNDDVGAISEAEHMQIKKEIEKEVSEIFYGKNLD